MDHVGITVPSIAEARAWFEDVIGCQTPLRFGPFSDPTGTFMQDLLEVRPARRDPRDQRAALRDGIQHRAVRIQSPGSGHAAREELRFQRPPPRVLRRGHRRRGRVHGGQGRAQAARAVPGHGRSRRRAVDQLLPGALRDVRRADLLSERHGLRGHRQAQALERPRHRRHGHEPGHPRAARPRPCRHHRPGHQGRADVAARRTWAARPRCASARSRIRRAR